jgi:DNA-binding XRE family transcriptional regulator
VGVFFIWSDEAPLILSGGAVMTSGLPPRPGTPGLGDARRRLREFREAERTSVLCHRLVLDASDGIRHQPRAAVSLPETHDPLGAFVLFEHVQAAIRSEAARQGSAAIAQLDDYERRYRLGLSIEARRVAAGMTQRELAARSGIIQHRISEIETGCANPTLRTLGALAGALGADLVVRP